jgi:predicted DNA binding CopG/RHH family protein
MNDERMTDAEMAQEAKRWAEGEFPTERLVDAPDAVPRAKESVAISIRLPSQMVSILKEFARRAGIGYQVLMKRWLDDRIREEHRRTRQERQHGQIVIRLAAPAVHLQAATFDAGTVNRLPEAATRGEMELLAQELAKKGQGEAVCSRPNG